MQERRQAQQQSAAAGALVPAQLLACDFTGASIAALKRPVQVVQMKHCIQLPQFAAILHYTATWLPPCELPRPACHRASALSPSALHDGNGAQAHHLHAARQEGCCLYPSSSTLRGCLRPVQARPSLVLPIKASGACLLADTSGVAGGNHRIHVL